MNETFQQFFQSGPLHGLVALVLCFLLYVVAGLLPLLGAVYLIYFLLTLRMRRNERARIRLALLAHGLTYGHPLAAPTHADAASREQSLSVRFPLLTARREYESPLHHAIDSLRGL